jgi:hypothetical protein
LGMFSGPPWCTTSVGLRISPQLLRKHGDNILGYCVHYPYFLSIAAADAALAKARKCSPNTGECRDAGQMRFGSCCAIRELRRNLGGIAGDMGFRQYRWRWLRALRWHRRIRSRLAETVSKDLAQSRRRIEIQIVPCLDAQHRVLPWPTSLKAIRNPRTDVAFSGRCVD